MASSIIETGVDKLVTLVKKTKKISIAQAAKALGVSTEVIEEWADFLEEEGIITVEYKLTTPYLVERDMNRAELEKKANEFIDKKDGFIRNAEVTVSKLQLDNEAIKHLKNEFETMKNGLAKEVKAMKTDFSELERYESLKGNLDRQISEAKTDYSQRIEEMNKRILKEKERYSELVKAIESEKETISKRKTKMKELEDMEKHLMQKVEEFRGVSEKITLSIKQEEVEIDDAEKHIERLESLTADIEKGITEKITEVDGILKDNEETKKKILEIQQIIVEKAKKYQKETKEKKDQGQDSAKKFEEFFKKKVKVEEMIREIEMDGELLERELSYLIKKAKAFQLSPNSNKMGMHVKELKTRFTNVEKRKIKYTDELKKLMSFFK